VIIMIHKIAIGLMAVAFAMGGSTFGASALQVGKHHKSGLSRGAGHHHFGPHTYGMVPSTSGKKGVMGKHGKSHTTSSHKAGHIYGRR
jgi:hypothetical protein